MADISQVKIPGVNTPYDIADTTARQAINDKSLGSLSDTDIQNPVNGQMLKYNSSTQKWENVNGGSGSGDMTKAEYDTNDDGVVNESDVSNAVKFSTTNGDINVSFGVEDGSYGYYDENNNFVDFKSQADIDSAIAAAKVGTATASDVLSGKTFTNSSTSGVNGAMPNNGAVSQALNAGEIYTIPQGYHNGSGEVTANSLASQTQGTATASDIANGLTAWVNGTKLTGTKEDGSVTITVTYDSSFYNKTMTCTKGTKTYTKTTTSSGSTTFNVNEEGTWTITCNGVSRTVNVVLSYSTQMAITKTVTVYGAAGATISFTDTTGSKTVTLNSSGQSSVSITFIPNQSITFTDTNVAKNPNNLSQNYSKTITIAESTTAIYVMPDGAIYWYGWKSPTEYQECTSANGWSNFRDNAIENYTHYVRCTATQLSGIGKITPTAAGTVIHTIHNTQHTGNYAPYAIYNAPNKQGNTTRLYSNFTEGLIHDRYTLNTDCDYVVNGTDYGNESRYTDFYGIWFE